MHFITLVIEQNMIIKKFHDSFCVLVIINYNLNSDSFEKDDKILILIYYNLNLCYLSHIIIRF